MEKENATNGAGATQVASKAAVDSKPRKKKPRTYNDIRVSIASPHAGRIVFVVVVFALLLVPLVGMAWAPNDESLENRELVEWPSLTDEDGSFNLDILSDMGDYFSDHYAYRANMIDAGAHAYASVFGTSTADTVIKGTNGWLYYAGTLSDYQNRAPLREGKARNIAHNARMLQDFCEERGSDFLFTIVPNKSTLYGQNMPYYYPQVESQDLQLVADCMEDAGVNYLDMKAVLDSEADAGSGNYPPLYFLRDSHWNEKGALIAHDALAEAAGFDTAGFTLDDFYEADDYTGDLAGMLYPVSPEPETNYYIEGVNDGSGATGTLRSGSAWAFLEGESVEDSTVETTPVGDIEVDEPDGGDDGGDSADTDAADENGAADGDDVADKADAADGDDVAASNGSLLMFRDSFGNSLIPYLACEFESATFSKLVPYNMLLVDDQKPQTVIIERAQRHMGYFAEEAPLMVCPTVDIDDEAEIPEAETGFCKTCDTSVNGPLACVQGFAEDIQLEEGDEILVRLTDEESGTCTYKAFLLSDDETENDAGYCVYASLDLWADMDVTAEVILQRGDAYELLGTFDELRFSTDE